MFTKINKFVIKKLYEKLLLFSLLKNANIKSIINTEKEYIRSK